MEYLTRARIWQRNRRAPQRSQVMEEPGSTPSANLMTIPTELRLRIYEYVFDDRTPITLFNGSDVIVLVNSNNDKSDGGGREARSKATAVLRVCRQVHNEAEDVFFNRTLFGIVASPYQQPSRTPHGVEGIKALPQGGVSTSTLERVRRLMLVMCLRGNAYTGYGYRMGNLTWLQAMTSLKEIKIVLTVPNRFNISDEYMAPIRAIVESVPMGAHILLGPESRQDRDGNGENPEDGTESSNQASTTSGVDDRRRMYAAIRKYLEKIDGHRGRLSGSTTDHSRCSYGDCVDSQECVNSEMDTPLPKKRGPVSRIVRALAPRVGADSTRLLRM